MGAHEAGNSRVLESQTSRRRERSEALELEALGFIPGGANSNFRLPVVPPHRFWDHAKGSRLADIDGNEFIDYVLGMGTAVLGHSPGEVLGRVAQAQEHLQCPAGQQPAEVELARRVSSLLPSAELVRVGCTGSEMVQLALRLARAATGRDLVIKFEGHYHGWFDSIYSGTTAMPGPGHQAAPAQSDGQSAKALAELAVLPWNDVGALGDYLGAHSGEVAAIIMEPVLCNCSVVVPRQGYLEAVRQACDRYGIVLIFDEVITGFRLHPGGAQALLGVTPDLTVLGKALGAGFPVAALAGKAELMERIGDGSVMHGGTYNANAMGVAAALAALEALSAGDGAGLGRLASFGEQLMEGLAELSKATGGALEVQGLGAVFNTTFSAPGPITDYRSYQASDLAKQAAFITALDLEGVRVTGRGTWFMSLAHDEVDLDMTIEAAGRALRRLPS